jgi:Flp pilus assembly protein TadG
MPQQNDPRPTAPGRKSLIAKLRADRRGAIAVIFAISLLPLILIAAFATDYGFFIQSQSQLNLAADAAALHAIRVASNRYQAGGTLADAEAMGNTAGNQWFTAQAAKLGITTVSTVNTNVTYSTTPGGFTATVNYSGTVPTRLGSFVVPSWNVANSSIASNQNSYVEILLMLDNSSSMQIGATASDIQQLMQVIPCTSYNAISATTTSSTNGPFGNYQCSYGSYTYNDPSLACPLQLTSNFTPSIFAASQFTPDSTPSSSIGPSCLNLQKVNGVYPQAGTPCAFACHWDNSKPAGSGSDNYAAARSTIGGSNPITLRFDVLKNAVNNMFSTINSKDAGSNVSVGVYTFNSSLTKIYPSSGEAGTNMTTAQAAVGSPPTTAYGADTGIQPDAFVGSASHSDTDFNGTMTTLANQVTASGDGLTASTPQKYLIIVTDGMQNTSLPPSAIDPSVCTLFKNKGFTVYVLNTPYSQLMNVAYFELNMPPLVTGTGSGSVTYELQQCATASTSGSNFISASNSTQINNAMNIFLNNALNSASRVTQ